jgi:hypothetical protein
VGERLPECLICGRDEFGHHDFSPAEQGCVCEPGGWDGSDYVPLVCRRFASSPVDSGRCGNCDHDEDCHKKESA